MNTFLIQLIPIALFFLSLSVPFGIIVWIRRQRKSKRNPLTFQMLRAPGESISERIEELNSDIDQNLTFTVFVPLLEKPAGSPIKRLLSTAKTFPMQENKGFQALLVSH